MKQAENSLKCKALLMKLTKTLSFSVPFDVINSSTFGFKTRHRSYFPLETGANCQTKDKKDRFQKFCVLSLVFRKKLTSLVHFENASFGIANQ